MKISQLFGKRAESATCKNGYVVNVCAEGRKITGFICADEDEQEFYVPAKYVKSIKNTLSYTSIGELGEHEKTLSLGKPVYDSEGNYLGRLTEITAERFYITYVTVEGKKFSADDVHCSDAVIVKNTVRFLKSDVKKNGKVIFRRGTPLTEDVIRKAQLVGEYVQTNLKTIQ